MTMLERTGGVPRSRGLGVSRLGRGLSFPVAPHPNGSLLSAEGTDKIRQAIQLILETEPGERIMRPEFGAGLRAYLFEPNTPSTRALIQRDVIDALEQWEPRIDVDEVDVVRGVDASMVDITISYTIRRNGRSDLLVYPFSLRS